MPPRVAGCGIGAGDVPRQIFVRRGGEGEEEMTAAEKRQYRIDHGLCPMCGEEAAPYYFCQDHRQTQSLGRMLNKMADRQIIKKEREGRNSMYSLPSGFNGRSIDEFRWGKNMWDMDANDKRFRPRLGRRPVDLDETLIGIFEAAGKRLTTEEVIAAWGKLRSQRKTASLAGDMTALIAAQRRRDERNAKRAKIAHRSAL